MLCLSGTIVLIKHLEIIVKYSALIKSCPEQNIILASQIHQSQSVSRCMLIAKPVSIGSNIYDAR